MPAAVKRTTPAADGVILEWETLGDGPPVVMLHGLWAGRAAWSKQHALAERFRLVMPSTRAHDGTDGRLPDDYGIGTTELDDLMRVLDAEGLARFDLVGHSSGGTLAWALLRRAPERVRRVVLIEPTLLRILHEPDRGEILDIFGGFAEAGRRHGIEAGVRTALEWLGGAAWARLGPERQAQRLAAMAPVAHLVVPHVQSLVDFEPTPEEAHRITQPVQLIYGGASYAMEAALARRLVELRPDWPLLVVDGAGHNVFREKPEVVNPVIERFLSQ